MLHFKRSKLGTMTVILTAWGLNEMIRFANVLKSIQVTAAYCVIYSWKGCTCMCKNYIKKNIWEPLCWLAENTSSHFLYVMKCKSSRTLGHVRGQFFMFYPSQWALLLHFFQTRLLLKDDEMTLVALCRQSDDSIWLFSLHRLVSAQPAWT